MTDMVSSMRFQNGEGKEDKEKKWQHINAVLAPVRLELIPSAKTEAEMRFHNVT